MFRLRWLVLVALLACRVASVSAQSPQLIAETEPLTAVEQQKLFHLPPGFVIELVAAEPDVRKPMNLKFDAAGRLFFTQSVEYPWPVAANRRGQDTIRVMTDTNGDGMPDKTEVFADGLNIPIGITPVYGGVLGFSIPTLNFFPDPKGELWANSREEYYGNFGFRDTHGMCSSLNWWIDGWVYGCHGFSNESTVKGQDGQPILMSSGNTYRLRPDGSHIEYYSHGQVNPFGMCLDPLGNVYTSDCHTRPAYLLVRGAWYPMFGRPHDGLGFGPELMQHAHGSTGIAGVVYYAAEQFPEEYRNNLFIGNPVTGRINRDTLEWTGSTAKAIEQPDFLTCDDQWFRPVDIQLGPDGALYVADFYNRIIGHYEVPLLHPGRDRERGRIWRIRYVGTDPNNPARIEVPADLTRATQAELIAGLGSHTLPIRVQATHQLVHRIGAAALQELTGLATDESASPWQRVHALWVVQRLGGLDEAQARKIASDPDRAVRVHLVKALGEQVPWTEARAPLREIVEDHLLSDADPFVRRAAAESLGKGLASESVPALIAAWKAADPADALLVHTIRVSLRDVLRAHPTELPKWAAGDRVAVADLPRISEVCLAIPQPEAGLFLFEQTRRTPWPAGQAQDYVQHAVRFIPQEQLLAMETLLAVQYGSRSDELQLRVLRAAQRGTQERGGKRSTLLEDWAEHLAARLIASDNEDTRRAGIDAVRDLRLAKAAAELPALLAADAKYAGLKPGVLDALAAVGHPDVVTLATGVIDGSRDTGLQQHAAQVLGGMNRDDSRNILLDRLKTAPQSLALAIARGLSVSQSGGNALLAAMEQGRASPRLLQDKTIEERLRAARIGGLDERRNKLLEGLPAEDERVAELTRTRRGGFQQAQPSIENGRAMYKQHCAACHRVGNEGGKVGPELDGVGLRGLDRLLEDTLDPSRNVDQAFRTTVVAMDDGKVITGLALREEGQVLVLADEQGREIQLPLNEIDERKLVKLSPMPANVVEKLTEAQYYDLLAFLLTQKVAKPAKE